jgi:hypothetical protein
MFFESIERELIDGMFGLTNRVESYPRMRDCWEIETKRQSKTQLRLLKDFKGDRAQ